MINNAFTICSLFYSLMLVIIYFKRKNFKSLETTIYSKMIVINILNITTESIEIVVISIGFLCNLNNFFATAPGFLLRTAAILITEGS